MHILAWKVHFAWKRNLIVCALGERITVTRLRIAAVFKVQETFLVVYVYFLNIYMCIYVY